MVAIASSLLARARAGGADIPLPTDVVVAKEFSAAAEADVKPVAGVAADEMILDIGPDTAEKFAAALKGAGTIVWNGPVRRVPNSTSSARAPASSARRSPAAPRSPLRAVATPSQPSRNTASNRTFPISRRRRRVLEFLEGKKLPAVEVLEQRASA